MAKKILSKKPKSPRRHFDMMSAAFEQTADHVVITDTEGVILYVNPAFEKTTGYTKKDAIGQTPRILQSGKHDEKFYKKVWDTILSGRTFQGTIINKKKNGELYHSDQTITPIHDEFGKISNFISIWKDSTERTSA